MSVATAYKNLFFDCDGVLWKQGKKMLGTFEILNELQQMNKNIYFVTNNCNRTRQFLLDRFKFYGYEAKQEQLLLNSNLLGQYIQQFHPNIKNVYCIGSLSLQEELLNCGVKSLSFINQKQYLDNAQFESVVVGSDCQFNYDKLYLADKILQKKNTLLFSTENYFKVRDQNLNPSNITSIAKAISEFSQKNIICISKPNTKFMEIFRKKQQFLTEESVFIGDNIEVDGQFSKEFGMKFIYVVQVQKKSDSLDSLNYENTVQINNWGKE